MPDPTVVAAKVQQVRHHLQRLRHRIPVTAGALDDDESFRNDILMDFLQAVQGCIDLAIHVCAHDSLGIVEGPASAFALLARAKIVDTEISLALAKAAGVRNLIVHRYGDLLLEKVAAAINAELDALDRFLARIQKHAGESG